MIIKMIYHGRAGLGENLSLTSLNLLAQTSFDLLGQPTPHIIKGAKQCPDKMIFDNTTKFVTQQFSLTFGYVYQGLRSRPMPNIMPIDADRELILVGPLIKNGSSIENFFQTLLQDSLGQSDSIAISNSLGQLIQIQINQDRKTWVGFSKRFNQPDHLIFDIYAAAAHAQQKDGKSAIVISFCFVAYDKP